MNILTQIALLAGLIAGISLIWLVGRAFSKHAAWGLAVLFLSPVTAVIFGIRYWRDEKGPFLVYVATFTTAVTLGLYVFTVKGGWDAMRTSFRTHQNVHLQVSGGNRNVSFLQSSLNSVGETSLHAHDDKAAETRHEQARTIQPDPTESPTNASVQAPSEKSTPRVTSAKSTDSKKYYRATYVPIPPSMADDYIGMTVKVKRLNRPEQDCVLRSVTPTALGFEQHARGGIFSFQYKHSDIEKLRVLVKQTN
jgi:hypothetical protein